MLRRPVAPLNCAVRLNVEPGYTAGQRCWQWVGNEGQCPTHGDVREVQRYFELTAELTPIAELVGAR